MRKTLLLASAALLLGAFAHFSGGFIREGDGGDALRGQPELNQVRDFVGDDTRLAGTGTGQHQTRALHMVDHFELRKIELRRHAGEGPK